MPSYETLSTYPVDIFNRLQITKWPLKRDARKGANTMVGSMGIKVNGYFQAGN
jgi:hypothetical protein